MKEYYIHGSEAYAPIPVEVPSHLPEDPKPRDLPHTSEEKSVSVFSVLGAVAVFALFLGLLISMAQLFEAKSQGAELQRQRQQLRTQQDRLIAQYESEIDIEAVAERAEEMGMHIPWMEQTRYIHIPIPQSALETAERVESGLVESFYIMAGEMESYFPGY